MVGSNVKYIELCCRRVTQCGRINQWFCGSSSDTIEFSHTNSAALCILVNTQRRICASRIHHSHGWCEACDHSHGPRHWSGAPLIFRPYWECAIHKGDFVLRFRSEWSVLDTDFHSQWFYYGWGSVAKSIFSAELSNFSWNHITRISSSLTNFKQHYLKSSYLFLLRISIRPIFHRQGYDFCPNIRSQGYGFENVVSLPCASVVNISKFAWDQKKFGSSFSTRK